MQVPIPEKISFKDGNGDGAGQFVVKLATAHNATDAELERYKADNDSKTDLLFAKMDKLLWWIIGTALLILMAVLFKK